MNKQYLIQVQDRNNVEFLSEYGDIIHVAKLKSLVIFEANEGAVLELSQHPLILDIRVSDKCSLAH
ncbi:hypothetical protein COJ37_28675 [Bacillus cereus]|nr:hypothetical protein [Bacillus cereus]PEY59636.1 hypothetical protein CN356_26605 [Bacillus cereus]PFL88949.1 hypothetical protein COJ37_28675 [Bacillus cereus]PFT34220.1 hypothetical protein COK61_03640 [Bacillus cereus]PFT66081.1 hypothetical protein COK73_25240 [Bacillus cereus]